MSELVDAQTTVVILAMRAARLLVAKIVNSTRELSFSSNSKTQGPPLGASSSEVFDGSQNVARYMTLTSDDVV